MLMDIADLYDQYFIHVVFQFLFHFLQTNIL